MLMEMKALNPLHTWCGPELGRSPFSALLAVTAVALFLPLGLQAQVLYYSSLSNPGWGGATAWNDTAVSDVGDEAWDNGGTSIAEFAPASNTTYSLGDGASYALAGLTNSGAGNVTFSDDSGDANLLTFSGGTIHTDGNMTFFRRANLAGDFTKTGAGTLTFNFFNETVAYDGTATVSNGELGFNRSGASGTNSNVVVNNSAELFFGQNYGTGSVGSVTLNATSTLTLGQNNNTNPQSVTASDLTGAAGTTIQRGTGSGIRALAVQSGSFAGTFDPGVHVAGTDEVSFTKTGTGDFTFATGADIGGANGFKTTTTVDGGGFYINTATTDFGDGTAGTAINVTGGRLGGSGTITATGGDDVVIGAAGALDPGAAANTVGQLTFSLTSGLLDISAIGTGGLLFDLGADTAAGSDYDFISLTSGQVALGTLDFDEFAFNTLAGFGVGEYTLFSAAGGYTGAIGTDSGLVGGFAGTLSFSGNDLVLSVVPEPSVALLLLLAGGLAVLELRRRRRA